MLSVLWNLSSAIRGYLRSCMPTNRAVDWLRTPRGLKWTIPIAVVTVPSYLFAMSICAILAPRPGFGWLNLLVMLFFWNAVKFASMAPTSLVLLGRSHVAKRDALRRKEWYEQGRSTVPWTNLDGR